MRDKYEKQFNIAIKAVLKASDYLYDKFISNSKISKLSENNHDFKILSDVKSEEIIIQNLKDEFPSYGIDSEEFGREGESDYFWYIDPLDGSNNFLAGIPYFGISICLSYKSEPIFSIIHNPILDKTFFAVGGLGCFVNDEELKVSNNLQNQNPIISFIRGHKTFDEDRLKIIADEYERNIDKGGFGRILKLLSPVIDYTLLVEGKIDVLISCHDEIHETIAGYVLCKESGIIPKNLEGENCDYKSDILIYSRDEKLVQRIINTINDNSR